MLVPRFEGKPVRRTRTDKGYGGDLLRGIGRSVRVALGCLAAFVLLTLALIGGPLPTLDEATRRWMSAHQNSTVRQVSDHLVWLGDLRVAAPVLIAAAAFVAWRARRVRALVLPLVVAGVLGAVVTVIKVASGRAEASIAAHPDLDAGGRSFPSGHVAATLICFGLAALMLGVTLPRTRRWAAGAAVLATLGTGWAMLYGHGHWLTDEVGSVLLGVAALSAYVGVGGLQLSRPRRQRAALPRPGDHNCCERTKISSDRPL